LHEGDSCRREKEEIVSCCLPDKDWPFSSLGYSLITASFSYDLLAWVSLGVSFCNMIAMVGGQVRGRFCGFVVLLLAKRILTNMSLKDQQG
jgi:hypothetical protein